MTKKEITTREVLEAEAELEEEKILEEETAPQELSEDEKDSDDEFMEDLTKEPLSPEKAKKMKEGLNTRISECEKIVAELGVLYQMRETGGLQVLKSKITSALHKAVDDADTKEIGDGKKQLENVLAAIGLINTLCCQYKTALDDIKRFNEQIEDIDIRTRQMSLPFEEKV